MTSRETSGFKTLPAQATTTIQRNASHVIAATGPLFLSMEFRIFVPFQMGSFLRLPSQ